jgi:hypothetical protein
MKITPQDPARHNSIAYPMEVGAPQFAPVPVQSQKDLMVNAARQAAQQEYNRIMQLVSVLQSQADDIQRRLTLTDQVAAAHYEIKLYPGGLYWLVEDTAKNCIRLVSNGPNDWHTSAPVHYRYIVQIQWLGDSTWQEVVQP